LLGADFSGDDDARFLRETFQRFKGLGIFLERADALDDSGTVAKNGKHQFAGFAQVVEPAANRYFLPVVRACLLDGDDGHSPLFLWECKKVVYQRREEIGPIRRPLKNSAIGHGADICESEKPLVGSNERQIQNLRRRCEEAICRIPLEIELVRREHDFMG